MMTGIPPGVGRWVATRARRCPQHLRSGSRALVLTAVLHGLSLPTAGAQQALITGVVRTEATDSIIDGAEVLLHGRLVARSDATGVFQFSVAPGSHLLEVRRIGFAPAAARLQVGAGDALELVVRLEERATQLDTVIVAAPVVSPTPKLTDFYLRKERWPGGQFFEREEILRHSVRYLSEFFRTVRGVDVKCIDKWCTGHILVPSGARAMPSLSVRPPRNILEAQREQCVVQYFLDGARIRVASDGVDGLVNLESIAGIEVYVGSSQVPVEFSGADARCGVVVMWTRDGAP